MNITIKSSLAKYFVLTLAVFFLLTLTASAESASSSDIVFSPDFVFASASGTTINIGNGSFIASSSSVFANNLSANTLSVTSLNAFLPYGQIYRGTINNQSEATSVLFIGDNGFIGIASTTPDSLFSIGGTSSMSPERITIYSKEGVNIIGSGCFSVNGVCIAQSATDETSTSSSSDLTGPIDTNLTQIYAWGDSITRGSQNPWPQLMEKLTGLRFLNRGFPGEGSSSVSAKMLSDERAFVFPTIIWLGRNNIHIPNQTETDIGSMTAKLSHGHFLVLSILNGANEGIGTQNYERIKVINNNLKNTYGDKFVDIRAHLISKHDPSSAQDVADAQNDIVPASLRSDFLHPSVAGNTLIAHFLIAKLDQLLGIENAVQNLKAFSPIDKRDMSFVGNQINLSPKTVVTFDDSLFISASEAAMNTFVGIRSGQSVTTGRGSTGYGINTLRANTTGTNNTAIGGNALFSNTTGNSNLAIGATALQSNTTGSNNFAMGSLALQKNTVGTDNFGFGALSLYSNISGRQNLGLGNYSLMTVISGNDNTAIGHFALRFLASGARNTAIGFSAGNSLIAGSDNILIGSNVQAVSTTSNKFLNIGDTIFGNLQTKSVGIGTANPLNTLDVNGVLGVGSPQKPSGVTIYDKVTKSPYCLEMVNGTFKSSIGACKI